MHRIGGLEKSFDTGHISYNADNHQKMVNVREEKIAGIADDIPLQEVALGNKTGKLALLGWGSTFGPIELGVKQARAKGLDVSHIHLRYINPLPKNLKDLLSGFERIMIPEMNMGQLSTLIRDKFLIDTISLTKVTGQPFKISEILDAIQNTLGEGKSS
jgi:2-oxoglutarate ferredoxin oxidoreductase subunit alpha